MTTTFQKKMQDATSLDPIRPVSATKCPHCKATTETGTRGGCSTCHKVKTTGDGRTRTTSTAALAATAAE